MRKQKGFIGPLGDDIPSIFPIVAGILIFIMAYGYIDNQIKVRDRYIDLRTSTQQMSYILTEKGYMDDNQFQAKCSIDLPGFANKSSTDYAAILKKYCGPLDFSGEENLRISQRQVNYNGNPVVTVTDKICSSVESVAQTTIGETITLPKKDIVTLSYPIAVDCGNSVRGLGVITIAAWWPERKFG